MRSHWGYCRHELQLSLDIGETNYEYQRIFQTEPVFARQSQVTAVLVFAFYIRTSLIQPTHPEELALEATRKKLLWNSGVIELTREEMAGPQRDSKEPVSPHGTLVHGVILHTCNQEKSRAGRSSVCTSTLGKRE